MAQRIEYLDALRGFTMILVVYSHVVNWSLGINCFSLNNIFLLFRMPLFFFVSGFLVEKVGTQWNFNTWKSFIAKKFQVQIIPTAIFFTAFCVFSHISAIEGLSNSLKIGYWFTFVLFEFFIMYSLGKFFKPNNQVAVWMIIFIIIELILNLFNIDVANDPLSIKQWWLFLFFLGGVLFKRHFARVQQMIDSNFIIIPIVVFPLCALLYLRGCDNKYLSELLQILCGASGVVIIFSFFRKYQNSFSQTSFIGRALQYIGRRTLDIYLLHYFVLPHHLQVLGHFFNDNFNPQIEFIVSISISLIVIVICLIISNVIRLSDLLSRIFWGVSRKI